MMYEMDYVFVIRLLRQHMVNHRLHLIAENYGADFASHDYGKT